MSREIATLRRHFKIRAYQPEPHDAARGQFLDSTSEWHTDRVSDDLGPLAESCRGDALRLFSVALPPCEQPLVNPF